MKELFKGKQAEIIHTVFQSLLVTYLALLLIEQVWENSVSAYLSLTWFLVVVIIAGVLSVFSEQKITREKVNWKHYGLIAILGVLGLIIIKFKTDSLGWLSWVISIVAGILIILLSLLVLEDEE